MLLLGSSKCSLSVFFASQENVQRVKFMLRGIEVVRKDADL